MKGRRGEEDDDKAFSSCLIRLGEQAALCQAWVGLLWDISGAIHCDGEHMGE